MFSFEGDDITKDFEHYLETLEWKNDFTRELQWVEFLQAEMDKAEQRTKEETDKLTKGDIAWIIGLQQLQHIYGYDYDIFGEYIERSGRANFRKGQFYTPMDLAKLVVELSGAKEAKPGTIINEPTAGSGRLMIATNRHDLVYINQDKDFKNHLFCTLNAALRGYASINIWCDTLAVKAYGGYATIPIPGLGRARWVKLSEEKVQKITKMPFVKKNYSQLKIVGL